MKHKSKSPRFQLQFCIYKCTLSINRLILQWFVGEVIIFGSAIAVITVVVAVIARVVGVGIVRVSAC